MNNSGRLIIVGCGSFAKELILWMIDSKSFNSIEKRLFFIDDNHTEDLFLNEIKITSLGKIRDFIPINSDCLYLGVANPKDKFKIIQLMEKRNAKFNSFIHPTAIIAKTSKIGKGCIVFPYSVCSHNSCLNQFVSVNLHSAIGHDVFVDSYSTISSFVDLTGKVIVGKKVLIGSGARFLPSIRIGAESLIGAGAIVFKSVPKGKTAYCQPAKFL